ncbi:hypothetical protein CHUAL_000743 [Chamberlinius hualienensis]
MEYANVKFQLIAGLVFVLTMNKVNALKCYTCTATEADTDCQLHPEIVPGGITNCNKKYCTLRRVEYINSGQVYSFYRSCEDNPVYVNQIIEDTTYRTYFYACSSDMCNGGAGKETNSDSQNNLPPGVTKPPFNEAVLHSNMGLLIQPGSRTVLLTWAMSIIMIWRWMGN